MGCCASSNRSSQSTKTHDFEAPRSSNRVSENRAPPSVPVEEETVKEVLSETPKWKPRFEEFQEDSKVEKPLPFINKADEISEVSEVCSLSESVSTTTVTDKRDHQEEETRQRVNRSPGKVRNNRAISGDFGGRRERTAGKSPGRRNVGSVRAVQSRDQMGNEGNRNHPRRRDAGEKSGRRSRSPAVRTDNGASRSIVGRSPSARRTNQFQSPARIRTGASESGRKIENSTMEGGKWPSPAKESLENPLVSLECFIFL